MDESMVMKHSISLYVSNKPGVLVRIALVFARRGYNVDSLVVSEAHDPRFSRMNITASGDGRTLDQILKQLNKLVDVIHARDTTGHTVIERELALVKVGCSDDVCNDMLEEAQSLECDVLNISDGAMVFQAVGRTEKIDTVHEVLDRYGVIEIVRTGKVLMAPGRESTS